MKLTKEQLIKSNAILDQENRELLAEDKRIREELTALLTGYRKNPFSYGHDKPSTESWMSISFLIGELKADADYSMCIQASEDLKTQIKILKDENYKLKNPQVK